MKSILSVLLNTSVLAVLALASLFHTAASTEVQLSLVDGFGTSKYRIVLDMPSEPAMGESLKIVFTLFLDELPPLKHYSGYVSITFTLLSADGRTLARTSINNRIDAYKVDYIFPGYRWGPYTVSINPDYSRITGGSKTSFYVTLESEEYVEDPLGIPIIATRPNPVTVHVKDLVFLQRFPTLEAVAAALVAAVFAAAFIYVKKTQTRRPTS
ncbi:MAG: hypothetical protein QW470_06730 [Candidatus Caldarchaeum sp.]